MAVNQPSKIHEMALPTLNRRSRFSKAAARLSPVASRRINPQLAPSAHEFLPRIALCARERRPIPIMANAGRWAVIEPAFTVQNLLRQAQATSRQLADTICTKYLVHNHRLYGSFAADF